MTKKQVLQELSLKGLTIAPSQVYGTMRIVPLLRLNAPGDLRLSPRTYNSDLGVVAVDNLYYSSYIPQGLVMNWSEDGTKVGQFGGQLIKPDGKNLDFKCARIQLMNKMAKRENGNQLRFLPLHLAMEGFMSMFFSGPTVAWQKYYSDYALSYGLGARWEYSYSGGGLPGLEEALRVFEIHENQVGVMLFVAGALASIFVVSTPEDYRRLHSSLLEDFYGELIYQYAWLYRNVPLPMEMSVDESQVNSLADLKRGIAQMRSDWASFQEFMAQGLLKSPIVSQKVYTAGPFLLQRFISDLQPKQENYIGEAIVRETGEIEYLKTYRLSEKQTRRVYLLSQLAKYDWDLKATAASLNNTLNELVERLEKAGWGYLLNEKIRARR